MFFHSLHPCVEKSPFRNAGDELDALQIGGDEAARREADEGGTVERDKLRIGRARHFNVILGERTDGMAGVMAAITRNTAHKKRAVEKQAEEGDMQELLSL